MRPGDASVEGGYIAKRQCAYFTPNKLEDECEAPYCEFIADELGSRQAKPNLHDVRGCH